jgi:hypothetical protein
MIGTAPWGDALKHGFRHSRDARNGGTQAGHKSAPRGGSLAVDNRVVWHRCQSTYDSQAYLSAALDRESAVTAELSYCHSLPSGSFSVRRSSIGSTKAGLNFLLDTKFKAYRWT